jgi:hypothetical protein
LSIVLEVNDSVEPTNYVEVVFCADYSKWLVAKNEENNSHHKNDTWAL